MEGAFFTIYYCNFAWRVNLKLDRENNYLILNIPDR